MATAVDVAHATYPKNKTPLEGMSLQPLFKKTSLPRRKIYWEHEGNRAIRDGQWKLVAGFNSPWELYNISTDRSEQHDLSSTQPERTQAMENAWHDYASRAQVVAWEKIRPNKRKVKSKK